MIRLEIGLKYLDGLPCHCIWGTFLRNRGNQVKQLLWLIRDCPGSVALIPLCARLPVEHGCPLRHWWTPSTFRKVCQLVDTSTQTPTFCFWPTNPNIWWNRGYTRITTGYCAVPIATKLGTASTGLLLESAWPDPDPEPPSSLQTPCITCSLRK